MHQNEEQRQGVASVLQIENLRVGFPTDQGIVAAVDNVSLEVGSHEVVGLVGESGSGKSVTAYSILGLVPRPGRVLGGKVLFQGEDLLSKTPVEMRRIRGAKISMVFQEPLTALNPLFRVETQIQDVLRRHIPGLSRRDYQHRVRQLLERVGISSPDHVSRVYPFELSGGMRQRVVIAMALACQPRILIADEPTTALDTTIQAQVLALLQTLVAEEGLSVVLITHNLGIVAQICDRVYVMYAGRIVEEGGVRAVFRRPKHPYTSALLNCLPGLASRGRPLQMIDGSVPVVIGHHDGCRFSDRCSFTQDKCRVETPELAEVSDRQMSACHFASVLPLTGLEGENVRASTARSDEP